MIDFKISNITFSEILDIIHCLFFFFFNEQVQFLLKKYVDSKITDIILVNLLKYFPTVCTLHPCILDMVSDLKGRKIRRATLLLVIQSIFGGSLCPRAIYTAGQYFDTWCKGI